MKRQFIRNMPGWLRAKLLEQLEMTSVGGLRIFARKQVAIHNVCEMEDSPMDVFSATGPTVTDTLINTLTNLSHSQEAMDNRMDEMSKKWRNRLITLLQCSNKLKKKSTTVSKRI